MGRIIPFKNRQQSLETLTNALLSRIKEGKFNQASSYSKNIIRRLEISSLDEMNAFLISMAPIVEALDWKNRDSSLPSEAVQTIYNKYQDILQSQVERVIQTPQLLKIRNDIYNQLFSEDRFLDKLHELVPVKKEVKHHYSEVSQAILGKTVALEYDLRAFITQSFKIIISKYGLLEQLMYIREC